VSIFVGIVQARTLGVGGKGMIAYAAIALSLFLSVADGLGAVVLAQAGRSGAASRTVHTALARVTAVLGVPVAIIILAIALAVPSQRPLAAVALIVPLAIYVQGAQGLFLATRSTRAVILQGALNTVVYGLLLIPLLIFAHATAFTALALWVLAWAGSAGYSFYAYRALDRSGPRPSEADVRTAFVEQIRRGFRNCLANFAGFVNLRIDVFLVSAVLGPRALGIYTLAVVTGEMLWSVSRPVVWSAMDRIAGAPLPEALALVARLTRNMLALQTLLATVVALVGPPLIIIVYGPRFALSGLVLQLLLPGMVAFAAEAAMGYFIVIRLERPLFLMATQGVAALVCAGISLAMFPAYGIVGAAAATSVTYCLVVIAQIVLLCRSTGLAPAALLVPTGQDAQSFLRRVRSVVQGCRHDSSARNASYLPSPNTDSAPTL
jgi:O-antigen/teichoic acid export membrane protein